MQIAQQSPFSFSIAFETFLRTRE